MIILGVETSCDETSVSVVRDGREVLSCVIYSQIDIHKVYGGVVPEVASRHHLKKITVVFDEALKIANITPNEIDLVCVSSKPGLIGSLLVGINASKMFCLMYNIKYVEVDHIIAHIYANYIENPFTFPLLALVVSGGHTELVIMKDHYNFEKIGQTLDDAVGEAYDKVGRVMGLDYPAGSIVDKLARVGEITYQLPKVYLDKDSFDFSFSGLKSAVLNIINKSKMKNEEIRVNDLCAAFQDSVVSVLVYKTINAANKYNIKKIILAGGVACNSGLRENMEKEASKYGIEFSYPIPKYCTDNAAMVAVAGYFLDKMKTNK